MEMVRHYLATGIFHRVASEGGVVGPTVPGVVCGMTAFGRTENHRTMYRYQMLARSANPTV